MLILWSISKKAEVKEGKVEDRLQHPHLMKRVSGDAFWSYQCPGSFLGLVNDLLRDMLNWFLFICLDDILIFSRFPEEDIHSLGCFTKASLKLPVA